MNQTKFWVSASSKIKDRAKFGNFLEIFNLISFRFYFIPSGNPLMPSRVAKNFLGALRKRGYGNTAADEECCVETCSYKEVSEYQCHTRWWAWMDKVLLTL